MADSDPGPSSDKPEDAVLGEVLVNQSALQRSTTTAQPLEDEDVALAKLLQEQERAFLALAGGASVAGGRPEENVPPACAGGPGGGDTVPLTDEELAWRLMQEEEAEFHQRMMALAGLGPTALESSREGGVALVEDNDSDGMDDEDNDDDEVHVDNMSYEQLTALGEVVGTVAVGLSEEQIAALPRVKYAAASKLTSTGSCYEGAEQCAVCRVEFEADDDVAVLTCHHVYHPDCVGQWLRRKKTCPQCGTEMDVHGGSRDSEDNKRSH